MRKTLLIFLFVIILTPGMSSRAMSVELLMFETPGCEWCEKWDEEIGTIYHNTDEGRVAPLRRLEIHASLPDEYIFIKGVVFTPTFVLVDNDREVGRIVGYPGEMHFWGLLEEMIQ